MIEFLFLNNYHIMIIYWDAYWTKLWFIYILMDNIFVLLMLNVKLEFNEMVSDLSYIILMFGNSHVVFWYTV